MPASFPQSGKRAAGGRIQETFCGICIILLAWEICLGKYITQPDILFRPNFQQNALKQKWRREWELNPPEPVLQTVALAARPSRHINFRCDNISPFPENASRFSKKVSRIIFDRSRRQSPTPDRNGLRPPKNRHRKETRTAPPAYKPSSPEYGPCISSPSPDCWNRSRPQRFRPDAARANVRKIPITPI